MANTGEHIMERDYFIEEEHDSIQDSIERIIERKMFEDAIQSLTPNAMQVNWRIPSEFPCCPKDVQNKPIEVYQSNLNKDCVFCKNDHYSSLVMDSAIIDEGNALMVMTRSANKSIKPWALARVVYKKGLFYHISCDSFFEEKGALKYFTLAQGKEWTGGDVVDDFC